MPKFTKLPRMIEKDYIGTSLTTLNPQDNGGEAVILQFHKYQNDDGEIYYHTEIKANCYGKSCSSIFIANTGPETFIAAITKTNASIT